MLELCSAEVLSLCLRLCLSASQKDRLWAMSANRQCVFGHLTSERRRLGNVSRLACYSGACALSAAAMSHVGRGVIKSSERRRLGNVSLLMSLSVAAKAVPLYRPN